MKKGKSILARRVLAGLLAGVLLGSGGYVQSAAAQEINVTADQMDDVKPQGLTDNKVTIGTDGSGDSPSIGTDGSKNVYGAYSSSSGAVSNNQIWIRSGKMQNVYGGVSNSGSAIGNSVYISGGTVNGDAIGGGSNSVGEARNNEVHISGGTFEQGGVIGGESNSGSAAGNRVYISGSTFKQEAVGGWTNTGEVRNNELHISGGTFEQTVYGGVSKSGGLVTGNRVYISGGTFKSNAIGGWTNTGEARNNELHISGAPQFADTTVLYGGATVSGTVSGNILNIHTKDLTAANVKGFDEYNFYLQNDTKAGDTLLNLSGNNGSGSNENTDLSDSTVNVGIAGTAPVLQVGDSVTLIKNTNGISVDRVTYGKITHGVSIEYEFTTALENNNQELVTKILRAGISDAAKSPVETQAAAVGFINSGADMLVDKGIADMAELADGNIFGAMSGGSMRYKSGSYADVKGYNFALGMGKAVANNAGKLAFGSFAEYGYGSYTSHLESGVRGDGKTKYYGIGLLVRQDNHSGIYYEGSLRYGRMNADYGSNDLGTAYDSGSAYYGAHLGIGKVTELNDSSKADVYTKLLYTHQNGDSVALRGEGAGEEYDFDAVDSLRARVGARVSKAYGSRGSGYVGLAYEYEFDGEAKATVLGFSTPSPSIKGSSGLLELGYILQAKTASDPAINIGLQGWGGKKQGFTGNVNFVWTF